MLMHTDPFRELDRNGNNAIDANASKRVRDA
jgi:hypothetical protein